MRNAKAVVVEAALVAGVGLLLAITANALSPRGLRLSRNYFPSLPTNAVVGFPTTNVTGGPVTTNGAADAVLLRLQQRGLQIASSNEVTTLFRDPRYEQGLIVFVDARDDAHYTAGHIPGAHQLNYYQPEQHLPTVLPACLGATKIVVYCTGGQCEDSEFAAIMLRDAGIPRENLFVYPGGINEWTALGQPLETGARRSGQLKPAKP